MARVTSHCQIPFRLIPSQRQTLILRGLVSAARFRGPVLAGSQCRPFGETWRVSTCLVVSTRVSKSGFERRNSGSGPVSARRHAESTARSFHAQVVERRSPLRRNTLVTKFDASHRCSSASAAMLLREPPLVSLRAHVLRERCTSARAEVNSAAGPATAPRSTAHRARDHVGAGGEHLLLVRARAGESIAAPDVELKRVAVPCGNRYRLACPGTTSPGTSARRVAPQSCWSERKAGPRQCCAGSNPAEKMERPTTMGCFICEQLPRMGAESLRAGCHPQRMRCRARGERRDPRR